MAAGTVSVLLAALAINPTHYGDPKGGCLSDEVVRTMPGGQKTCNPKLPYLKDGRNSSSAYQDCPKDHPAGTKPSYFLTYVVFDPEELICYADCTDPLYGSMPSLWLLRRSVPGGTPSRTLP